MCKAYEKIADELLKMIDESGALPWQQEWCASGFMPANGKTGREYHGGNVLWLSLLANARGYSSNYWVTFKQARDMGGCVRKGEKGSAVLAFQPTEGADDGKNADGSDKKKRGFIKYYTVFNVDQCDGVEIPADADHEPIELKNLDARAIVENMPKKPIVYHEGGRAFYSPSTDTVTLPALPTWKSESGYWSTYFHELAHATGHESRLNRKLGAHHANDRKEYSAEELVAEFAAAFLCGRCGLLPETKENSAAYVKSWRKYIESDKQAVGRSISAAMKAADFIVGGAK